MTHTIWHNKFINDWMRAFPLGNGRIGAMVYGNPSCETIEINEESLWSGRQISETSTASPESLEKIRKLLFAEKFEEAAELCRNTYLASPPRVRFYESFGEIKIDFNDKSEFDNYRKELKLDKALTAVSYTKNGVFYRSEALVSEKYDIFAYKITADKPFSCNISIERAQDAFTSALNENTIVLNGTICYSSNDRYGEGGMGMGFGAKLHIKSNGNHTAEKHFVSVSNATEITVFASFETNYNVEKFDIDDSIDYKKIINEKNDAVKALDFEHIKFENIKDHKKWYDKNSLWIESADYSHLPTDERLKRFQEGFTDDAGFYVLYYNFGRYLLIESSGKKAKLPANLQGIWCNGFTPPWGSDYHTNINLQMNYWPACPSNMTDAEKPLIHFMKKLSTFGKNTAKELFDAHGWAINHTTDIFGRSGVHDNVDCGFFPMAGPWMCLNLWEHYEFTNDTEYLNEIYPVLRGSCEFLADYLTEYNGFLVTSPSNSPENKFFYMDGDEKKSSMFTYGATIDFEIIFALFTRVIHAADVLGKDKGFAKNLSTILDKLPPLKISKRYGTICEWIKDYEETEPAHRHISHLFGLFPGDQINETNAEIYNAAKLTIARRLAHGGGATGWSRAWIINFYARLKDNKNAFRHLSELMRLSTAENLFDMHPPFQIDGNFGAVSGICEMLVQSHRGSPDRRITELLPALPEEWSNGKLSGIKIRGNFELDIEWNNRKMRKLTVKALCDNTFRLSVTDKFLSDKKFDIKDSVLYAEFKCGETAVFTCAE